MLESEREQNVKNQDLVRVLLQSPNCNLAFKLFCRWGGLDSAFSHAVTKGRLGDREVEPTSFHLYGILNANTTACILMVLGSIFVLSHG